MNAPDRFELFLLPDGVQKLTVTNDPRTPNTALIKFEREDHTLGNMLRAQLLQDPRVVFAAYKVEHPLFANFIMRLQTEDNYTPREALKNACYALIGKLNALDKSFSREWDIKSLLENDS
ncbi:DNA-directed RNA polymerase II subunit Rpb11p [Trichomonascus vanleenenianus]|uniref:DNA-directed RNA polymerase II core subunit RPB11 n=1 Tax=Trichomonascus vanleenenianus TaxID=2268995 RepID=UPI003EC96A82